MEIITHKVKIFNRVNRQEKQKINGLVIEINRKRENMKINYGEKENKS